MFAPTFTIVLLAGLVSLSQVLGQTNSSILSSDIIASNTTTTSAINTSSRNLTSSNVSVSGLPSQPLNAGRSMNILPQPDSSHTSTGSSSSTSSLVAIAISLIAVICVVVVIVAALFVMRQRFSFWRNMANSNGAGSETKTDAENNGSSGAQLEAEKGVATATDSVDGQQVAIVNESESEALTSVENKLAVVKIEAVPVVEVTSETPLLTKASENIAEAVVDATVVTNEVVAPATNAAIPEQTSSTSLIANVLNELSESVVAKLATSKSPVKSDDPEKQPLNSEQ